MTSGELTKLIPDIDTRYFLTLADLNSNSSVSLCEIAQMYDVPRSTLQARWKGRRSAKAFHTTQQRLSVHKEDALIQGIDTMTAWG